MSQLLVLGKTIGRCRIEKLLGAGAMGAVYQGTHEALRVPVAVKFLATGAAGTLVDDSSADRFMREAQLAATLRHPNIVRVYDVGADQGLHYITMELLAGVSFARVIEQQGPLSVDQVRHFGRQVADALAHAHAKGVIHRDIKPDNVMIAPDGTAVLTDFGIAAVAAERANGASGQKLTRAGHVVGTPWYLAPEQAKAGVQLDARADIYALGVVLYEALTSQMPFDGDDGMQQMLARLTSDPIPITTRRRDLPEDIVALVHRMLAREPAHRIQTAAEVAEALGGGAGDRTLAPPTPMAMTSEMAQVNARTSELTAMADSAGLPFATPQGAHLVELRMADIRATVRLAEEESADGAALLLVHRLGEADVLAFAGRRAVLALRVQRGVVAALSVSEVLGGAMRRGEGALVVRKIDAAVVAALRCWLEGPRALGPLPTEVVRPMGLFARLRRTRTSGVLAATDRGQTTLVMVVDGALKAVLAAPVHRQELATESEGGIGVWLESCSQESTVLFAVATAAASEAPRVSAVPDEALYAVLTAACDAAAVLAADAAKEFGLGSAQVFAKYLREATTGMRDVVPVAALSQPQKPVDLGAVWQSLAAGPNTGRDVVTRMFVEAVLGGAVRAAAEILPPKKLAKSKQAALTGALKARPALDALGLTVNVQRLLGEA